MAQEQKDLNMPNWVCCGHPPNLSALVTVPLTQRICMETKQMSSWRRPLTYALPLTLADFNLSLMFFHCGTCLTANTSCLDSCVSLAIQCPHLRGTFLANICPRMLLMGFWGSMAHGMCARDLAERCHYTTGFTEAV